MPSARKPKTRELYETCAGCKPFPGAALPEAFRSLRCQSPMTDLSGGVGGSMKNFPVQNESAADSGTEREKDQVAKPAPVPPSAKPKLRKRARVPVMLDIYGQPWKSFDQLLLQMNVVPTGQMRRIEQEAFTDSKRTPDGNAERYNLASCRPSLGEPLLHELDHRPKRLIERTRGEGGNLAAPIDLSAPPALDAGDLGAADIEADYGTRYGVHLSGFTTASARGGKGGSEEIGERRSHQHSRASRGVSGRRLKTNDSR